MVTVVAPKPKGADSQRYELGFVVVVVGFAGAVAASTHMRRP
jgi:hypothetical protein